MKLPYKLQQFWLRKGMWEWTFNAWQNLMFPHIYDKGECEECDVVRYAPHQVAEYKYFLYCEKNK